jgi:hypothetical protein
VAVACCGCKPSHSGEKSSANTTGKEPVSGSLSGEPARHPAAGPHGGALVQLANGQYYAEILKDEDAERVSVNLLDSTGTKPVKADKPELTIQLFHDGQFEDFTLKADDDNSTFSLVDTDLCFELGHGEKLRGRLRVTIGGKGVSGTITDAGCGHDHGADGEHSHAAGGHQH